MISAGNTTALQESQQKSGRPSNPTHLNEWVEGSAVDEAIATLAIESLTAEEMNERIKPKTPIKTGGWWCRGVNWRTGEPMGNHYGQGKPDKPHNRGKGEKPAKYMTASGVEPDAVFLAMPDKDYWLNVYSDKTIARVWTEGVKKAGAGLSIDLATIALTGVWNWGKDGQLAPDVKKWAQPNTHHVIAFDSDYQDKKECRQALRTFVRLLLAEGVASVKIAVWDKQWKGMDDFIVANGGEAFKDVVVRAETIAQWEKHFKSDLTQDKDKFPTADKVARQIAEDYLGKLAYNNAGCSWVRYEADNAGVWASESNEYLEVIVRQILDSKGITGYGSFSYITNIVKHLRTHLFQRSWPEASPKHFLPFQNGVLEIATGKLLPHSPHYYFTWQIPRQYNSLASNWTTIDRWMDEVTGGKPQLKKILLCWLNATLKGRSDLQVFLHLTGPGGTGKGTFTRLVTALIGERNTHSSNLMDWNGNRFETANAHMKRLVVFPDEDKYSRNLGNFKSLTGGDFLRGENKGQKAFQYQYDGMVILASNYPIFAGDTSSGMARRTLMVPFHNQVSKARRRNLETEFETELDALTNYVLSIPDTEVTATLHQLDNESAEVVRETWEYRMRVDSIASWLNECLIHDPEAQEAVGIDREDLETLFGSYYQFTTKTGGRPKGIKEFSPSLLELCRNILGWKDVERVKTRVGRFIKGLRLRRSGDDDGIPHPIEGLYEVETVTSQPVTVTDSVTAESIAVQGCDGCDGSNELFYAFEKTEAVREKNTEVIKGGFHPSQPSPSVTVKQDEDSSCHEQLSPADTVTGATRHSVSTIKVGSAVKFHLKGSKRDGKTGVVCKIDGDKVRVRFDDFTLPVSQRLMDDCLVNWLEVL